MFAPYYIWRNSRHFRHIGNMPPGTTKQARRTYEAFSPCLLNILFWVLKNCHSFTIVKYNLQPSSFMYTLILLSPIFSTLQFTFSSPSVNTRLEPL